MEGGAYSKQEAPSIRGKFSQRLPRGIVSPEGPKFLIFQEKLIIWISCEIS